MKTRIDAVVDLEIASDDKKIVLKKIIKCNERDTELLEEDQSQSKQSKICCSAIEKDREIIPSTYLGPTSVVIDVETSNKDELIKIAEIFLLLERWKSDLEMSISSNESKLIQKKQRRKNEHLEKTKGNRDSTKE